MSYIDHTYAVILAGGGGTRLWPKSRNKTPKQFLKLIGEDTMMQISVNRITQMIPPERVIVVTNQLYKDEVAAQLPQVPVQNIIAEPEKKDTALAMLTGSLYSYSLDKEAIIINCASDHTLSDQAEFIRVMNAAAQTASELDSLVTVGIRPTFPSSGFGYIKIGSDLQKTDQGLQVFKVESFTEKPNKPTAQGFIATGKYFWNANMYVWSAKTLLEAFKQYMPSLYSKTEALQTAQGQAFHEGLIDVYQDADSISIDYAISEKATNLVLIPGDFGWNDVGDWKVVFDIETKDANGNVVIGEKKQKNALSIDSSENLIHTNGRLVALVGVKNMIIIDTEEILMIIPQDKSQDVKKIVEELKEQGKKEYL